jgi:regulator of protease activity HflC (stomatin/prohibitin superfamily)
MLATPPPPCPLPPNPPQPSPRTHGRLALGTLALLAAAAAVALTLGGFAREDPGHVGVVRNGGPQDRTEIRQMLLPGRRVAWSGWLSQSPHIYPSHAVQLTYRVTGDAARRRPGTGVVTVPTRDGVQVGIEATVFYRFVGESRPGVLGRFDTRLGTRRFPAPGGRSLRPWEGDDGYEAMVAGTLGPVLADGLRALVGRYRCAQVIASCIMVRPPRATEEDHPLVDLRRIEDALNRTLQGDLDRTLDDPYFSAVRVRLQAITLPAGVQHEIDVVETRYAQVGEGRAAEAAAAYKRRSTRLLDAAYRRSPALERIHEVQRAQDAATIVVGLGDG